MMMRRTSSCRKPWDWPEPLGNWSRRGATLRRSARRAPPVAKTPPRSNGSSKSCCRRRKALRRRSRRDAVLFEQQRLDDDRHHVGELDHVADVDIVEFLELHAVDCDHVSRGRDLVPDDAAEAFSHVAVDQEAE